MDQASNAKKFLNVKEQTRRSQEKSERSFRSGEHANSKIQKMAQIGMLSALATILMYVDFPLPFVAPPFYKLDFSELPVLIGAFAMGPVAGIAIELVKILVNLMLKGTQTGFVGELANFLIGCSLIVPASLIYKWKKSKKGAVLGLASGTVFMTIVGCFLNAFLLLPAYALAFGAPVQSFVDMGAAITPAIKDITTFALFAVAPFNIIKGVAVSAITLGIYKYIKKLFHL